MAKEITIFRDDMTFKASNALLEAQFSLKPIEQRVLIAFISLINKDDKDFQYMTVRTKDLMDYCEVSATDGYTKIIEAVRALRNTEIIIYFKKNGKKGTRYTSWIMAPTFYDGMITFCIDPWLKPELLNLSKGYYQCNPKKTLFQFNGRYTGRLYLLLAKLNMEKLENPPEYQIDWIIDRFGLPAFYKTAFTRFKERFFLPSIKEINEKSDIYVEFEFIKVEARYKMKNKSIRFNITRKDEINITPPTEEEDKESSDNKKVEELSAAEEAREMLSLPKEIQEAFDRLLKNKMDYKKAVNYIKTKNAEYINVACDKYAQKKKNGEDIGVGVLEYILNKGTAWNEYVYKKEKEKQEQEKKQVEMDKQREAEEEKSEEDILNDFGLSTYFKNPESDSVRTLKDYIEKKGLTEEYLFEFAKQHSFYSAIKAYNKKKEGSV